MNNTLFMRRASLLALPLLMMTAGCSTKPGGSGSAAGGGSGSGLPPLAKKAHYTVAFSQVQSDIPWRIAETKSMSDEAAKRGDKITVTDATGSATKQISDMQSLIAQHPDLIFLAPDSEKPLAASVLQAKAAGIPVILLDRTVDASIAKPGKDYVTFIGSDFVQQGKEAADWLIKDSAGKAKIIELEGTTGSSPAIDRKKGFDEEIKSQPGMQIIASQPADFTRDKGRQVMETLLQAHPDVTAVYAHNDDMALGAVVALQAAGKHPGTQVKVISIDGSKEGLQDIANGTMNFIVQSSPFFGPVAFDTMDKYAAGEKIPDWVVVKDKTFDKSNANTEMSSGF